MMPNPSGLQKLMVVCTLMVGTVRAVAQVPVGAEFRVREDRARAAGTPTVCVDESGRFLVGWEESTRIWLRPFSPGGDARELPLPLSPLAFFGYQPQCGLGARGEGGVVWASGEGVAVRTADVDFESIGEATQLWQQSGEIGRKPSIAFGVTGAAAVGWVGLRVVEDRPVNVWVGVLNPDGSPAVGPIAVFSNGLLNTSYPTQTDVAWLDASRFVVVWSVPEGDSDADGILARIYRADGNPETPVLQVNTFEVGVQTDPEVAADGHGNFMVVWDSFDQDGSGEGIYAQRFDRVGLRLGGEIQVSSDADSGQYEPSIAMDSTGNAVVAFSSVQETNELREDVFVRAYLPDGNPAGEQVLVNQQTIYAQNQSSVALSDAGDLIVAWHSEQLVPGSPFGVVDDIMARVLTLPCHETGTTLCLANGRFRVRAFYDVPGGASGPAIASPLSPDSGMFWFFSADDLELFVKLVDGCDLNGAYWFFAGGLTDVTVELEVTDTWTGARRTWRNPGGELFAPVQEISAFTTCPATTQLSRAASPAEPRLTDEGPGRRAPTSAGTELVIGDRFRVTATWRDFDGREGVGNSVSAGAESGLFWFFDPDFLELGVKIVDGCAFDGKYWVFATGLTNVAVELTVEDLVSHFSWTHNSELGEPFPPIIDIHAFGCLEP